MGASTCLDCDRCAGVYCWRHAHLEHVTTEAREPAPTPQHDAPCPDCDEIMALATPAPSRDGLSFRCGRCDRRCVWNEGEMRWERWNEPATSSAAPTPATQGEVPAPCPFCGGAALLERELRDGYADCQDDPDAWAHSYRCGSCGASGGWAKSGESGARRWWNMRPPGTAPTPPDEVRGLVEEARRLVEAIDARNWMQTIAALKAVRPRLDALAAACGSTKEPGNV